MDREPSAACSTAYSAAYAGGLRYGTARHMVTAWHPVLGSTAAVSCETAAVTDHIAVIKSAEPLSPRNRGCSRADLSVATLVGYGPQLATAGTQLRKCIKEEHFTVAESVRARIAALMMAEPCSQRNRGRSRAVWIASTVARHDLQPAIAPWMLRWAA